MKTCPNCNGAREVTRPLEGVGMITAPCEACAGNGGTADCDHADRTAGFMPGIFYCNLCPAKLHLKVDGTVEVLP